MPAAMIRRDNSETEAIGNANRRHSKHAELCVWR